MVATLRRARAADREKIAQLFARHLEALGYDPDPELDADMTTPDASYTVFLVAEDGGVIGMGGIDRGEVRRIYVEPDHRKRGVARMIVGELVRESRALGQRTIRAVVPRDNDVAKHLFTRLGFRPTGRSPEHPKMKHCEIFDGSEAC
jgi:ribosomal protein S18 acetylase RimI-like enzyme